MFNNSDARNNEDMVTNQIYHRGIQNPRVIQAFLDVDRIHFVSEETRRLAYSDHALGIDHGQTISQPYMVAIMTDSLQLSGEEKVLEIGTGCGYQTALLSRLAAEVFTIERIPELSQQAQTRLRKLGFSNISFRIGDGFIGWPESAPFDRIIVTAAPEEIPNSLVTQLKLNGFMLIPVGKQKQYQVLYRVVKTPGDYYLQDLGPVAFVPMLPGTKPETGE